MAMAGGDTVMVQPTSLEPMPAMPTATRAMAIIPMTTATTPTVATDAFWFATSERDGPANTADENRRRLGFAGARDRDRFERSSPKSDDERGI